MESRNFKQLVAIISNNTENTQTLHRSCIGVNIETKFVHYILNCGLK